MMKLSLGIRTLHGHEPRDADGADEGERRPRREVICELDPKIQSLLTVKSAHALKLNFCISAGNILYKGQLLFAFFACPPGFPY